MKDLTPYHSMEIYKDDAAIAAIVADLFSQTRALNQPCLIIARSSVIQEVSDKLALIGVSADGITVLSSAEMLDALIDDRLPDPAMFRQIVGDLLDAICKGRDLCIVTIYSDMADILISRENTMGAVGLELLWNEMAGRHMFTLVCGYHAPDLRERIPSLKELDLICREHNRVSLPRADS